VDDGDGGERSLGGTRQLLAASGSPVDPDLGAFGTTSRRLGSNAASGPVAEVVSLLDAIG
jgi:hypothetical protein